jgi:hypothetical protein
MAGATGSHRHSPRPGRRGPQGWRCSPPTGHDEVLLDRDSLSYDLVSAFDTNHDMARPVEALIATRRLSGGLARRISVRRNRHRHAPSNPGPVRRRSGFPRVEVLPMEKCALRTKSRHRRDLHAQAIDKVRELVVRDDEQANVLMRAIRATAVDLDRGASPDVRRHLPARTTAAQNVA